MFSLKDIKAVPGSKPIYNLSSLNEAKGKLHDNKAVSDENYNYIYNEALTYLDLYANSTFFDTVNLHKAAEKLADALEIRKNNAEPYFYLAYIFNHLQYKDLAQQYYEIARMINPELRGLKTLNKFIKEIED